MTGYGNAKGLSGMIEISVEVKSVNSRYLDCGIKIPRVYIALEELLKSVVQKSISRGKVDVFVTIDTSKADDVQIKVNMPIAGAYVEALRSLTDQYGLSPDLSAMDLTRFPEVLHADKRETDIGKMGADVCAVLEEALAGFDKMRLREGEKLSRSISERLEEIERLTEQTEKISPRTLVEYRKKLEARMSEILQNADIDESRILVEAAIFADRTAIDEETVRLRSHIAQLREMLRGSEPVGRKIDFLVQELNREANTIGSKGNDAEMAKVIIDLKAEIEKIREQAQNVE